MTALPKFARRAAALGASTTLIFSLAACGGGSDEAATDKKDTEKSDSSNEAEAEEETEQEAGEPDWANPVTEPGEKLTTVEAGDVKVDVYQVDVVESPKAGSLMDKETKELILDEGDDIVFLNFVITNTGDPVDLGSSLVQVDGKYKDWKYLGGMPSISDSALFEEMEVNSGGLEPGKNTDPTIYTLGTNETFSYGENYLYQKGSDITFTVGYTPVDDQGELIHDDKVEGEGDTKLK